MCVCGLKCYVCYDFFEAAGLTVGLVSFKLGWSQIEEVLK